MVAKLSHIYFLGGSPCAGKTSAVKLLAQEQGLNSYHCDEAFSRHQQQALPDKQPTLYALKTLTWDEIWLGPLEHLVERALEAYREHFAMIWHDLQDFPSNQVLLVEGADLLPECLAPLIPMRRQASFFVPTETFLRQSYPKRGSWVQEILAQCSQPKKALENWLARDTAIARRVKVDAEKTGFRVLEVDGKQSIPENAAWLKEQFQL